MRKDDKELHRAVQKIDRTMWSINKIVARFGMPKGVAAELRSTKKAVGDVIAKAEMVERRQKL